jgi:glycosyltransferase involved in cell wall biosynthesis
MLGMTVESIFGATRYPQVELIVVDDGSTDGSCGALEARYRDLRVVRTGGLGVARARNAGARQARGKYVVFLDAHCRVSPDWLWSLAEALDQADAGLAGPAFTRLEEPEPRGCGMVWSDYSLEPCWLQPLAGPGSYDVPLTTGACQGFRRATFWGMGGYEEGFTRWGFEDMEICLRTWLLGYRVVGSPAATVAHHFRESRNYAVDDADITYNFLRMIHLHFSAARIRQVLRAVGHNRLLSVAMDRLYEGDVFRVRGELSRVRVHDDAWFFGCVNLAGPGGW